MSTPPKSPPADGAEPRTVALDGPLGALELIINDDGSVTFVDLPPELLDIAHALNPDDPLVCERRALLPKPPEDPPREPENEAG